MTQAELRELQARVTFLIGSDTSAVSDDRQIIAQVLAKELSSAMSLAVLQRLPHWSAFCKGATILQKFLEDEYRPTNRPDRIKGYTIFIGSLTRWMTQCEIVRSHRTMCQNLDKIPGIIDQHFPGYRESRLLAAALRSRRH